MRRAVRYFENTPRLNKATSRLQSSRGFLISSGKVKGNGAGDRGRVSIARISVEVSCTMGGQRENGRGWPAGRPTRGSWAIAGTRRYSRARVNGHASWNTLIVDSDSVARPTLYVRIGSSKTLSPSPQSSRWPPNDAERIGTRADFPPRDSYTREEKISFFANRTNVPRPYRTSIPRCSTVTADKFLLIFSFGRNCVRYRRFDRRESDRENWNSYFPRNFSFVSNENSSHR
ncbi:uncharacterized protein LOC143148580 [Ptiloglossa arizonensis]|uniref:uncharacterized protein LOC143148580 n=1 Tax=Ptiloglossa arizonensis TaxID=3350558 RepID=UPI003FA0ABBD